MVEGSNGAVNCTIGSSSRKLAAVRVRRSPSIAVRTRRAAGPPPRPRLGAYRGCLLGGAVGDALGYPIELVTGAQIERRFGRAAPGALCFDGAERARVSDDTQLALFTAEGLIRAQRRLAVSGAAHPTTAVAFSLLRWHGAQDGGGEVAAHGEPGWLVRDPRLRSARPPRATCVPALEALRRTASRKRGWLPTVERPANASMGCGAAMRVAPCGLAAHDHRAAFLLARDSAVLTHGHPRAYLAAAYLAALIWDLVRGASLADAMARADALLATQRDARELAILRRARELARRGVPSRRTIESLGGGWTGDEALAIALLCVLTFDGGVEACLWRAAAHSGDSDGTAALTGHLLGAMLGLGGLPWRWTEVLELRDVIDRLATDLYAAAVDGEPPPVYPAS